MSPFIPPAPARPVASAGGLTQARPGCGPHIAFHSTGAREAGGLGGWPDTGATRLWSSYRLSFHRRPRGRRGRRVAEDDARPGCVPHIAFHSTGGCEAGGLGGWPDTGAPRLWSSFAFHSTGGREAGSVGGSPETTRDPV